MALLHNRVSQRELKELLYQETEHRITISFYRYFHIDDPQVFRDEIYKALATLKIFGRIYVAHEGINAQVSVPESNFQLFKDHLDIIECLKGVRLNIAVDDDGKSFWVLKIKVREKIVADGINDPDFDMRNKGRYVNADEFNQLTNDPETIVIDMRNHYEFEVGHFENAIEIPSDTFREQLPMAVNMMKDKKDKNIIMYCTGGIRCEKASAYMLHHGFTNVFHLEGGIINYTQQIRDKGLPGKFTGKNFVFDDRLGERITPDIIAICHQCGRPADNHTNCANSACHLLFIQCPECALKFKDCCSSECLSFIQLPLEEQAAKRKGIDKGSNIFNKSRERLRPVLDKSIRKSGQ
ncbi:MAG: rhodanese-related sulfurtransferase [Chitinophagaceae bacterium]|jgi:UPF0176 protein|nr:rhodanese-related sulfurtransferase [Chitinophagaceae bacterium]